MATANEHPKITVARMLIEAGKVQSFSEVFTKGKLPIKVLAEVMGKPYQSFRALVQHPGLLQLSDIREIAGALAVDYAVMRDLVWVDVGKKRPQRENAGGHNQN